MKRKQRKQEKIFDNAFRSLEEHCPELFVPLVNEIFGKNYSESAIVARRADVHVKDKRIDTDGCLEIGGIKYHLECQSKPDGTIAIRMFEYDVAIALEHKHKEQGRYVVDFPCSCVIYLRQGGKRKKEEIVSVRFSDGKKIDYKVPVRNIHSYSKEELFEKKLYVFLPFYLLRYQSECEQIEGNDVKRRMLLDECKIIVDWLENQLGENNSYAYAEITQWMKKIAEYLFQRTEKIKKGVGAIMGGEVMESFYDQAFNDGVRSMLEEKIEKKISKGKTLEQTANELEEKVKKIKPIYMQVAKRLGISPEDMGVKMGVEDYLKLPYTRMVQEMNDERGHYFYGRILELDGCQSTADTLEELYTNLNIAMEGYLEVKIRHNLPIPKPQTLYSIS